MLAVLENLPKPEVFDSVAHPSGASISGASFGNGLVSVLHGVKVPDPSYTIGVLGRGTLNLPEAEFKQLLSCMASIYVLRFPKDPFIQAYHGSDVEGDLGEQPA